MTDRDSQSIKQALAEFGVTVSASNPFGTKSLYAGGFLIGHADARRACELLELLDSTRHGFLPA